MLSRKWGGRSVTEHLYNSYLWGGQMSKDRDVIGKVADIHFE